MSNSNYIPPQVWQWTGEKTDLNQPTSGARYEHTLPVGKHPHQLYSLATPNGQKVTILLEELLALGHQDAEYDAWLIKIGEGQQFGSGFVEANPNSKIPILLDQSESEAVSVFESANILLYLAEKFGHFLPTDSSQRTAVFNWLFSSAGAAPFLGGGFGHFFHYAPEKIEYPINRFAMEAKRQLDLLDKELAKRAYIAGDEYSIADIAIWSWYGQLAQDQLWPRAGQFLNVQEYKNLQAWTEKIAQRPAVKRGLAVEYKSIK